jgi:hypothetical protein
MRSVVHRAAIEHGTTDGQGHTHLLTATVAAEIVDIYV